MLKKRICVMLSMVCLAGTAQVQEAQADDSDIRCWGTNDHGQCDVPSGVGEPGNLLRAVAAGTYHTVARLGKVLMAIRAIAINCAVIAEK